MDSPIFRGDAVEISAESSLFIAIRYIVRSRLDTDQGSKVKDPLALPIGPITRARAIKLQVALNAFVQEQVTLELQDPNYARCGFELEEAPKLIMVLEACKEAAH
ncbi:hypothetical protein JCGZ_05988 [Jatropha curcas]|uniref:Uncharacterized protein n=1 Tax=Jatropha curcas TaxID=180498 RepID=A0A067L0C7_JATCU|nr:hypothetical protein JCGZ_05988 [Jatropha curcas]